MYRGSVGRPSDYAGVVESTPVLESDCRGDGRLSVAMVWWWVVLTWQLYKAVVHVACVKIQSAYRGVLVSTGRRQRSQALSDEWV